MDELLDILDSKGNFTGKTALKSEAHLKGLFHATVHIWFFTSDGKLLIQQRGKHKETHPLLWDVSVAGHVGAGEEIEQSATREVQEEIDLTISKSDLEKIGVFKSVQKHREDLIDREFHHTYLCELKVPLASLQKQESEVEALDLISMDLFLDELENSAHRKKYVPHDIEYYKTIIEAVYKRL
jgi:isopentenyldiphosphate isomerase